MKETLKILSLYPEEMNMYGDHGNILVLQKRCEWRDIKTMCISHNIGQKLDTTADIIIGGGGQDSGQRAIQKDLQKNSANFHRMVNGGTPMLLICGMYQMFGKCYETCEGRLIDGIGVFDAYTKASSDRLIGNITVNTKFGEIIGYENHSGLTYLNKEQKSFGKVVRGAGNNGVDNLEGAILNNTIGSYLHGPILPNNPKLADEIIKIALENRNVNARLKELDDSIANKARSIASRRQR